MESSGRPEQVHISDKTSKFLDENYVLEDGEEVDGSVSNVFNKIYTKNTINYLTHASSFYFSTQVTKHILL